MNADLTALATNTVRHLQTVWDAIGVPAAERETTLAALTAAIQKTYTSSVDEAEQARDALTAECASIEAEIAALVRQLDGVSEVAERVQQDENSLVATSNLRARVASLLKQRAAVEQCKQNHVAALDAALASLHALWTQLGTEFEAGFEAISDACIDAARLRAIEARIADAHTEMAQRTEVVHARVAEICDLVQGLCVDAVEVSANELLAKIVAQNVDAIGVHARTMQQLDEKKAALIAEKQRRQERLKKLAVKITALWDRLAISTAERQAFFGQHRGLGLQTLEFCECELARLEQQKRDKLQEQTEAFRARLHTMWDECHCAHEDRVRNFPALAATQFSDEVYDAHEAECRKLEAQVAALRPILALIERRNQILHDKGEYEEMLKNPNRFKIAGWSIREEGIRKMLNKEFPKLNARLLDELSAYEDSYGELLYEGVQYRACLQGELSSLHSAEEEEKTRKERERARNFQGSNAATSSSSSAAAAASVASGAMTPRKPSAASLTAAVNSSTATAQSVAAAFAAPPAAGKSASRPQSARTPLSASSSAAKGSASQSASASAHAAVHAPLAAASNGMAAALARVPMSPAQPAQLGGGRNPENANTVQPSPRVGDAVSKIPRNNFGFAAVRAWID